MAQGLREAAAQHSALAEVSSSFHRKASARRVKDLD
jgi:hypothetical protein